MAVEPMNMVGSPLPPIYKWHHGQYCCGQINHKFFLYPSSSSKLLVAASGLCNVKEEMCLDTTLQV